MLNYINPIELLNLYTNLSSGLDGQTILKAKKTLLAEIELSDNDTIFYNRIELTKSDCLRVIDDLDHKDKRDFHLFIYENSDLNHFLTSGNLNFFRTFKTESIYKLQDFIDFISPYFSVQYAKALSRNFKTNNFNNVKSLLSVKPIVNDSYIEDCYKSTYATLKEIENEIIKITKDIEFKKSEHIKDDFSELPKLIKQKVNIDLINLLPSYFQSLRNQFAETNKILAVTLNNAPYSKYRPAFELIEIANAIQTDGLAKQKITKSYYIIKKNFETSIPKPTTQYNSQQTTQPKVATVEIDNDDEKETTDTNEEEKESKNIPYLLFLIAANAIGFFYIPVQKIILGLSLLMLLIPLIAFRKDKDFSIGLFLKRNIIFIGAVSLGIFYTIIAQLYISYYFLIYLNLLFDAIIIKEKDRKSRFGVWHYTAGAVIITFLYYNYFTELKPFPSSSNIMAEKQLTDKECFQKGSSLFHQSNFTDAIVQFDKAINLNPNYTDAYLDRGASKANLGQYEGAISDYQKAEELGLKTSILYSNWGYAYYQLKQPDKARTYLERALEIDPNNGSAYRFRGDIKYDKNDNKGAEQDYTKAISSNPNASNYFARGLAFYYLKDYKKAIADMDKAIQLSPNTAQYYFDRGDAKDMINDFDGACRDWQTAKDKGYSVPDYKIKRCTPQIVYVPNGELSGCNEIKPKYNKGLDNKLLITVGSNASVAVKLINISNEKCIRYVFINKNSTYSIRNIPEGRYYLKIAYGDDWSIMDGQSYCTGRFTKNTLFEKGEDILDYNLVYSGNGYQVPSFSLKLDVIITEDRMNSFNTDKINENDFYNE
jgi:tetratricopeptide (TPR) repeat protein